MKMTEANSICFLGRNKPIRQFQGVHPQFSSGFVFWKFVETTGAMQSTRLHYANHRHFEKVCCFHKECVITST